MTTLSRFRDCTQIVLPWGVLDGIGDDLEAEFTVTVYDEGADARIIGSPVVIKEVSAYLSRRGVRVQ